MRTVGFDFIEASLRGYTFLWHERSVLLRAALPWLFVKLLCVAVIYLLGVEGKNLLGGLVSAPASIVGALYIISVVHFVAFGTSPLDYRSVWVGENAQKFKAGVLLYLLIKTVQMAFVGSMLDSPLSPLIDNSVELVPAPNSEPTVLSMFTLFVVMGGMIWAIRLVWLYIPVALGSSIPGFLSRVRGMRVSWGIFSAWFMCYFPLVLLFAGVFILSNAFLASDSMPQVFVHEIIRNISEIVLISVQAVVMTYGFIGVLSGNSKR